MKRGVITTAALVTIFLSACNAPKESESPAPDAAGVTRAENDEVIKQEAKTIEAAADEAAALIEAEANGEMKAIEGAAEIAE